MEENGELPHLVLQCCIAWHLEPAASAEVAVAATQQYEASSVAGLSSPLYVYVVAVRAATAASGQTVTLLNKGAVLAWGPRSSGCPSGANAARGANNCYSEALSCNAEAQPVRRGAAPCSMQRRCLCRESPRTAALICSSASLTVMSGLQTHFMSFFAAWRARTVCCVQ